MPARTSRIATAVPNEPAPMTDARLGWVRKRGALMPGRLRNLVVRAVATLGRRQAPTLGGDGAALHAVRRRDLHLDQRALQLVDGPVVLGHLLLDVLGQLVNLRRAHVVPHRGDLERDLLLELDVVRSVV